MSESIARCGRPAPRTRPSRQGQARNAANVVLHLRRRRDWPIDCPPPTRRLRQVQAHVRPLPTADEHRLEEAAVNTTNVFEPDALHEGGNARYRDRKVSGLWSPQHDLSGAVLRHKLEGQVIDLTPPTADLPEAAGAARPGPIAVVLRLYGALRRWRPIVAQRDHAAAFRTKAPEALPQPDSNLVLRKEVGQRIVAGQDSIGRCRPCCDGADVGDEAAQCQSSARRLSSCPTNGGPRNVRANHFVAARRET